MKRRGQYVETCVRITPAAFERLRAVACARSVERRRTVSISAVVRETIDERFFAAEREPPAT